MPRLVEVRCFSPEAHLLGAVYRLPVEALEQFHRENAVVAEQGVDLPQEWADVRGRFLFVSTDTERLSDLPAAKAQRDQVIGDDALTLTVRVRSTRRWAPLVDLLDHHVDDDREHAVLSTRCRCGERPPADRHTLVRLAREALADGTARRVFV